MFDHINVCIEGFYSLYNYKEYNIHEIKINYKNALYSIDSLLSAVQQTPYPIYLLIDEYDNFANTVMMGAQSKESRDNAIVYVEESP